MSDFRFDPIFGQWVSIAKNRNDRPIEFVPMEKIVKRLICPFCRGSEQETPNAWSTYLADGTVHQGNHTETPWLVRVVPNKYPSFSQYGIQRDDSGSIGTAISTDKDSERFDFTNSYGQPGVQDLIIPSSKHIVSISDLTEQEIKMTFLAYQDRLNCLRETESIKHAMLFTNCRSAAGASLEHIHSQLIGVPIVSDYLQSRVDRCEQHFAKYGESLMQTLLAWELKQGDRIIEQTENFTAYCPFASRFPFQVRIAPSENSRCFLDCADAARDELAMFSQKLVTALEVTLDDPAYNVMFQIAPFEAVAKSEQPSQQWSIELFPRMTIPAGFELGTDIWVNPVAPEIAARRLRATFANLPQQ